ncbi:hypothetical protein EV424DRAFT_909569 [Suillus variegatus]|nr:hypothetical protein EV424DRAFT_909569 [Suillus variegatus]
MSLLCPGLLCAAACWSIIFGTFLHADLVLPSRRVKLDVKSIRFGNDQNRFNSKLRFESSCTSLGSRFTNDLVYFIPYIVIPCEWPQAHMNIITMSCRVLDIAATATSKELSRFLLNCANWSLQLCTLNMLSCSTVIMSTGIMAKLLQLTY